MSVPRHAVYMNTVHTRVQCQIDYWASLNSKQDLSALSMLLWVRHVGANKSISLRLMAILDSWGGGSCGYIRVLIE